MKNIIFVNNKLNKNKKLIYEAESDDKNIFVMEFKNYDFMYTETEQSEQSSDDLLYLFERNRTYKWVMASLVYQS